MVENKIQGKNGIINFNESIKNRQNIVYAKKIMLGVLSYVLECDKDCEFGEYFKNCPGRKSLIDDSVIM